MLLGFFAFLLKVTRQLPAYPTRRACHSPARLLASDACHANSPSRALLQASVPAWGSLLLWLSGVANSKASQFDWKQTGFSLAVGLLGLAAAYVEPVDVHVGHAAAAAAGGG